MSVTRTTPPTSTRVNLGPLTTTFTPPRSCKSLHFIGKDQVMLNADSDYYCPDYWRQRKVFSCTTGDCSGEYSVVFGSASLIESCYPPGLASYLSAMSDQDNNDGTFQPGIFSPGLICPSGYSPDCTVVRSKGVPRPAANAVWDLLDDGETAIGCCPFNYTCDSNDTHMCTSQPPLADGGITVTDTAVCSDIIKPSLTTSTALTAWAARVFLIQSNTPTVGSSTSSALSSETSSAASSATSYTSSPNSTNLSFGGEIAIIVTLSLVGGGVIVIAIVYFICRIRSRRRKLKPHGHVRDDVSDISGKAELHGSSGIAISGPNGTVFEKDLLDGTAVSELAAETHISELEGGNIKSQLSTSAPSLSRDQLAHSSNVGEALCSGAIDDSAV